MPARAKNLPKIVAELEKLYGFPLPPDVTGQLPDMQKFGYAMNGDQLLVINPVNMVVVDVIKAQ